MFAFTVQFLFTGYMSVNDSALMVHSFGSVWMFMAFVDDITIDLGNLDTYNRKKTSDARLYEHLCEFIRFNTEIKQLSDCEWLSHPFPINCVEFIVFISF